MEPWKLLPSLAREVRVRWGMVMRKTCSHDEIVQKPELALTPAVSHAGRLTKVVCTPLVPPVSRNTRGCTPRGHIVRTWPFLLQILPNCSQCIFIIGLFKCLHQIRNVVYLLHTLRAHKLMKQHMLVMSCAHRMHALVHTWCTQKYQKKYSKPLIVKL